MLATQLPDGSWTPSKKLRGHATHMVMIDDAAFFTKPSTPPAKR